MNEQKYRGYSIIQQQGSRAHAIWTNDLHGNIAEFICEARIIEEANKIVEAFVQRDQLMSRVPQLSAEVTQVRDGAQRQIDTLNHMNENQKKTIQEFRSNLEATIARRDELRLERDAACKAQSDLHKSLNGVRKERDNLQAELVQCKHARDTHYSTMCAAQADNEALRQAYAHLDKQNVELRNAAAIDKNCLENVRLQRDMSKTAHERAVNQLSAQNTEITELRKRVATNATYHSEVEKRLLALGEAPWAIPVDAMNAVHVLEKRASKHWEEVAATYRTANEQLAKWKAEIDERRRVLNCAFPHDYDDSPKYAVATLLEAATGARHSHKITELEEQLNLLRNTENSHLNESHRENDRLKRRLDQMGQEMQGLRIHLENTMRHIIDFEAHRTVTFQFPNGYLLPHGVRVSTGKDKFDAFVARVPFSFRTEAMRIASKLSVQDFPSSESPLVAEITHAAIAEFIESAVPLVVVDIKNSLHTAQLEAKQFREAYENLKANPEAQDSAVRAQLQAQTIGRQNAIHNWEQAVDKIDSAHAAIRTAMDVLKAELPEHHE